MKQFIINLFKDEIFNLFKEEFKEPQLIAKSFENPDFWTEFFRQQITIKFELYYYDENDYMLDTVYKFGTIAEFYSWLKKPDLPKDFTSLSEFKLWIYYKYKNRKEIKLYNPLMLNTNKVLNVNDFLNNIKKKIELHPEVLL